MAHTIYCGKIAKRKNSTLRPDLSTSFSVLLKSPTSLHTPTFSISAETFDYNYIQWGDRYYFVTDVVSRNNNLWDVSCVCDVLATYKADILNSTQFVSYSSHKSSIWLPDTRLPMQKNATVASNSSSMNTLFNSVGFYVLSAVGRNGCELWICSKNELIALLDAIGSWTDDLVGGILGGNNPLGQALTPVYTYDFSTPEKALESLANMNMLTGFAGNAYREAPACIRSCVWVPFYELDFAEGGQFDLYLGQFDTKVDTSKCKSTPVVKSISVSIPWQFSDWRRSTCEEIYLYLPLVGMVSLSADELINESAITVTASATATDGCIAYKVSAGNQTIGTYGANCAVNFPIGISQQSSAGEIVQSAFKGFEKTVSIGVQAASSLNPAGWAAGGVGIASSIAETAYNIVDTTLSSHTSCIGGIGGGAGAGLSLDLQCFSVAHPTTIEPDTMLSTMGVPTMQPLTLSTLSGFCQCANAHVEAYGAELSELAEIDGYLNSGFYIE